MIKFVGKVIEREMPKAVILPTAVDKIDWCKSSVEMYRKRSYGRFRAWLGSSRKIEAEAQQKGH